MEGSADMASCYQCRRQARTVTNTSSFCSPFKSKKRTKTSFLSTLKQVFGFHQAPTGRKSLSCRAVLLSIWKTRYWRLLDDDDHCINADFKQNIYKASAGLISNFQFGLYCWRHITKGQALYSEDWDFIFRWGKIPAFSFETFPHVRYSVL